MYNLLFFRRTEASAQLRFGISWRIVFSLIALLFFFISFSGTGIVWAALVFAVISTASALYVESWEFIRGKTVVSRIGVWPVSKKKTYDISSASSVVIETPRHIITKNLAKQSWSSGHERMGNIFDRRIVRLMLKFEDGQSITIYAEPTRKLENMSDLAQQLSEFLGIPFVRVES